MKRCLDVAFRSACAFVLAFALVVGTSVPVLADEALHVLVVDGAGTPVPGARVLDESSHVIGVTGANGAIDVSVKHRGSYHAERDGIVTATMPPANGSLVLVLIRSIGTAQARVDPSSTLLRATGPQALAMGGASAALDLVPNFRSAEQGGSGTTLVEGVPLPLPPAPGGQSAVPDDLVESASVTEAESGSTVPNFHLLSPTSPGAVSFSAGARAYDGSTWKSSVRDVHGHFGYALVAAGGGDGGPLAGTTLSDSSGLSYDHSTHARHIDGSAVFSYHPNVSSSISLVAFGSRARQADIGTSEQDGQLAGVGPYNEIRANAGTAFVRLATTHGRDTLQVVAVTFGGSSALDDRRAFADSRPIPSLSAFAYAGRYEEASATRAFDAGSLTLKATDQRVQIDAHGTGYANTAATSADTAGLSFQRRSSNSELTLELKGYRSIAGLQTSMLGGNVQATTMLNGWRARLGTSVAPTQEREFDAARVTKFDTPNAAAISCDGQTATIRGSSDAPTAHPRTAMLSFALDPPRSRFGQFRVGGFASQTTNAIVRLLAVDEALDPALAAALGFEYRSVCGAVLPADGIVTDGVASVRRLRGDELYVSDTWRKGRFTVSGFYETFADRAVDPGPQAAAVRTTLLSNAQLPGVPLHRANALVAYAGTRWSVAADALFTSANNAQNLPSHTVVSLGAATVVGPGRLEFSVQNVLGSYSRTYTEPDSAIGIASGGDPFRTLAIPLHRTWSVRYVLERPLSSRK